MALAEHDNTAAARAFPSPPPGPPGGAPGLNAWRRVVAVLSAVLIVVSTLGLVSIVLDALVSGWDLWRLGRLGAPVGLALVCGVLLSGWSRWPAAPLPAPPAAGRNGGVLNRTGSERALARARDEAEAASRAKSRFLATMSHEIRTPMNGVLGLTGLLLDTELTKEQQTYARAVERSGRALMTLIDEILDFSKIEAGEIVLNCAPFDLADLVEGATELLAPKAYEKDIGISCFVDPSIPERLCGDEDRLRQVLLNLTGNAIKFTNTGGVRIDVRPAGPDHPGRDEPGGVRLRFRVTDTGIGMPADALERVFHEFQQVDSTRSRKYGGTGLGLAITRRLVERMGGRIEVASEPGTGSSFSFVLSLPPAPGDRPVVPPGPVLGQDVLLAGPDPRSVAALADYIRAFGATVHGIYDHGSNTAAMTGEPPCPESPCDLIVDLDIGLDRAGQLAGRFRDARAGGRAIILINPDDRDCLAQLKRGGFNAYLIKPVRRRSLLNQLTAAPERYERSGEIASDPGDEDRNRPAPARRAGAARRALTILLAEDNEINALLAVSILEHRGHAVVHVENGRQALDAFRRSLDGGGAARDGDAPAPFDLILMDVHMPELDGLEATRMIRKTEREVSGSRPPTPIIALTANAFPEDRDICLAAGMDDFLTKPIERDSLDRLVDTWSRAARKDA